MADKDVDLGEVRRWAKDQGIEVAAKGAIAKDVIEQWKHRDQTKLETPLALPDMSTSDAPPAGHTDVSGIEDEVTATVDTAPADNDDTDTPDAAAEKDEWMRRYRAARAIPENHTDADVAITAKLQRNRVSIQTLENGFIHYQRATGTDEVQARLVAGGFLSGYASGQADENTVQAYARFQDSLGLPGTGIPERTSLEALDFDVLE